MEQFRHSGRPLNGCLWLRNGSYLKRLLNLVCPIRKSPILRNINGYRDKEHKVAFSRIPVSACRSVSAIRRGEKSKQPCLESIVVTVFFPSTQSPDSTVENPAVRAPLPLTRCEDVQGLVIKHTKCPKWFWIAKSLDVLRRSEIQ